MKTIESVELNIYFSDDEVVNLDLTASQFKGVITMLGLSDFSDGSYNCFSDEVVEQIAADIRKRIQIRGKDDEQINNKNNYGGNN